VKLENKGFLPLPVLPVQYRTMPSGCRAASDRRVRAQRNDRFGISSPEEGQLDATAGRQAGLLRVHAIYQDAPFTKTMTTAIGREVEDLADWLRLELTLPR
jgi:hypothetical protein